MVIRRLLAHNSRVATRYFMLHYKKTLSEMKTLHLMFLLLIGFVALTGCKKDDDTDIWPGQKEELIITIQDQYTTLPAKVSVFFKVETNEGEPVAGLTDSDFSIYEKGRNDEAERLISVDEAKRKISSRQQIFVYNTLLILDISGSVSNNYLEELKVASKSFIDAVMPNDQDNAIRMKIMWFDGDDQLHPLAELSSNKVELKTAIDTKIVAGMSNDNSTDLYGAVVRSNVEIDRLLQTGTVTDAEGIIAGSVVIFTDGTDQAARHTKAEALDVVKNMDERVSYYTIGLGSEIDVEVLMQIGKDAYAFAEDTDKLVRTFEVIATKVHNEANSYYLFEYCSPKRHGSGTNDLRIQAVYEDLVGSSKTNFDATGFEGGCNL